jgi:hypothetical protein
VDLDGDGIIGSTTLGYAKSNAYAQPRYQTIQQIQPQYAVSGGYQQQYVQPQQIQPQQYQVQQFQPQQFQATYQQYRPAVVCPRLTQSAHAFADCSFCDRRHSKFSINRNKRSNTDRPWYAALKARSQPWRTRPSPPRPSIFFAANRP